MTSSDDVGRFVWHDLMSKDVEAAKTFYTGLFGWTIDTRDMGAMGKYDMIVANGVPIGGFVPLENEGEETATSHWVPYVATEDIEACVQRCEGAGGKACSPVMEIPEAGRFTMINDPQGAVISPWQSTAAESQPVPEKPHPGTFAWNEMHARDANAALAFYQEAFGWGTRPMDMGPMGVYHVLSAGERDVAGIMPMPPDAGTPPSWLCYVGTEDVDATVRRASELRGTVLVPGTDIAGVGRFAVLQDPTGGTFALYHSA